MKPNNPLLHNCCIDAVFTWVDGEDEAHQQKRLAYAGDQNTKSHSGFASTRFANNDEIYYALHLLKKNAPWIRTIFLVTDQQCPRWLDAQMRSELQIELVHHETLFKGWEFFLPTFNSQSLEAFLPRIPGLSDYFIYLNDDFFIVQPVEKSDFFNAKLQPVYQGQYYSTHILQRALRKCGRGKILPGLVGKRAEIKELGIEKKYFRLAHTPYPISKSLMYHYMDDTLLQQNGCYRFRDKKQIWPISYFCNRGILEHKVVTQFPQAFKYIAPDTPLPFNLLKNSCKDANIKFLCIQSLDQFPAALRQQVFDCLKTKLQQ